VYTVLVVPGVLYQFLPWGLIGIILIIALIWFVLQLKKSREVESVKERRTAKVVQSARETESVFERMRTSPLYTPSGQKLYRASDGTPFFTEIEKDVYEAKLKERRQVREAEAEAKPQEEETERKKLHNELIIVRNLIKEGVYPSNEILQLANRWNSVQSETRKQILQWFGNVDADVCECRWEELTPEQRRSLLGGEIFIKEELHIVEETVSHVPSEYERLLDSIKNYKPRWESRISVYRGREEYLWGGEMRANSELADLLNRSGFKADVEVPLAGNMRGDIVVNNKYLIEGKQDLLKKQALASLKEKLDRFNFSDYQKYTIIVVVYGDATQRFENRLKTETRTKFEYIRTGKLVSRRNA